MRATPLPAFKQARRGSNPQPPVLETGALPVELRTSDIQSGAIYSAYTTQSFSGQGRNRTTDTTIFSRVLYQLSYLAATSGTNWLGTWPKKIRPTFSEAGGSARGARSGRSRGAPRRSTPAG